MKLQTEITIAGAHHLPRYDGPCKNNHGHSWRIIVTLDGKPDTKTGMMMDFKNIKQIINTLDHQNINDFVVNPTAENICLFLLDKIAKEIDTNITSITCRIYESEKSYVEETIVTI